MPPPKKTMFDMTPMINISFIVLVALMVISAHLSQSVLKVKLPRASIKEGGEEQRLTITYTLNHRLAIGDKEVSRENFYEVLKKAIFYSPNFIIVIQADGDLPYGDVEKLIDVVKGAGGARLVIATEQKNG